MTYFLVGDSITLTLLALLIIVFAYYVYNFYANNIFRQMGLPGPTPIPLLGELWNIMRKGMNINDVHLFQKYGKIIGVYEGTTPVIFVSDPELLRKVLIKDAHIFINRRSVESTTGPLEYGLTVLKDDAWKNARAVVSPTFSTAKLKAMRHLMDPISDVYNDRLLEYADKQEIFNVKELNGQYTLDNIASCLFGIETNSLKDENGIFIRHLKTFFEFGFTNIFLLIFLFFPRLATYLGKKGYTFFPSDSIAYLSNVVSQVLDRRRQRLERRNDFIQIMVDHEEEVKHEEKVNQQITDEQQAQGTIIKKTLNDKEILAQAIVFLIAGYETTSVLMSFFLYVMATEPVIQEKVYEEILQQIGDDQVTAEKLNQLPYLDMVLGETLRMYPPFIRFDRVASEDYQLGGYRIKKGSVIGIPVYPIHHDADVWTNPDKFVPERFSAEEKAKRHPMSYLPFGEGPRNCIGMRFALLEAKLGIVKALRLVEVQKCEKTEVPLQLGKLSILSSKNGIWIRVVRRSE